MTEVAFLSRFTPSLLSPETLEAIFVQREPLAQRLVERIRESALTDNKHYALLVGPRGIGKTHLVSLVYHRVRKAPELSDKIAFAWLKEEEWGIASYLDFLRCVLQAFGVESLDIELEKKVDELYDLPPEDAVRQAEQLLLTAIGDRTLLLIAENLDQIFQSLGRAGQEQLRALIQNQPRFTILATSQGLFNGVSTRTAPFFGFFTHHYLDALSFEDALAMLTRIAEHEGRDDLIEFIRTPRGRARVRAAHHLAGGNHRVYVIFSQFLTRDSLDQLVQPVMQTLDDLNPYYQTRMAHLSPQQRKIVAFLTEMRHPVMVGQIARKNRLSPQTASSQLKKLRGLGYVGAHQSGRESYYELSEPLMRLVLEIKNLRGAPLRRFIEFIRRWYANTELRERLTAFGAEIQVDFKGLLTRTSDHQEWREHAGLWIETSAKHDALACLGLGLVQSIRSIVEIDWLTVDVAEAWNAVWQELGAGYPDLELPLRLLDAAVRYLRKPSERVLLSLTAEERPILIDLLGLDREEGSGAIADVA